MSSHPISGWTCAVCHKWVSFGEEHGHGAVTGGYAPRADDLRALANDYARAYDGVEGGISRLAHAVLTLLTSLEAAERWAERAEAALGKCEQHFAWRVGETHIVPTFSVREPRALLSIVRAALRVGEGREEEA